MHSICMQHDDIRSYRFPPFRGTTVARTDKLKSISMTTVYTHTNTEADISYILLTVDNILVPLEINFKQTCIENTEGDETRFPYYCDNPCSERFLVIGVDLYSGLLAWEQWQQSSYSMWSFSQASPHFPRSVYLTGLDDSSSALTVCYQSSHKSQGRASARQPGKPLMHARQGASEMASNNHACVLEHLKIRSS